MKKAIVLSSGGVDSTTCLALAIKKYGKENVTSVSINYGQKHTKELECAEKIAKYYGVAHYELNLAEVLKYSDCSLLTHSTKRIKKGTYAEQLKEAKGDPVETCVPFRNGLFLSAVTSLALSLNPNDETELYCGIHADDAADNAYPDCSPTFNEMMGNAIYYGSYKRVTLTSPFVLKTKTEVVKKGLELKVPYELTWSCYEGKDKACGRCGTCIDRLNAFHNNNEEDPIEYE